MYGANKQSQRTGYQGACAHAEDHGYFQIGDRCSILPIHRFRLRHAAVTGKRCIRWTKKIARQWTLFEVSYTNTKYQILKFLSDPKIPKRDKGVSCPYFHILYAHINYFALPSLPLELWIDVETFLQGEKVHFERFRDFFDTHVPVCEHADFIKSSDIPVTGFLWMGLRPVDPENPVRV